MLRHFSRIKEVSIILNQKLALQSIFRIEHAKRCSTSEILAEKDSMKPKNPFIKESSARTVLTPEFEDPDTLNDEQRLKKLKVLQLEADIFHQEGRRVPELTFFQDKHWEHILKLPSKSGRIRYYAYLWQLELKTLNKEKKNKDRKEAVLVRREMEKKSFEENPHIIYAPAHTTLFLRIYDSTMNFWHNNKLTRAMQFGEKLVLDCSYDHHMNHREALNTAKQLTLCFAENRLSNEPFDIHFCNFESNSTCNQALHRSIPTLYDPEFPMNIHTKCFTEVFPKEKLVYLTPHCKTDLKEYNPDDIYIIGAIVDKVSSDPVSLAKAKKLGIRMARFPLDRYLQWGSGSGKSLTLNQCLNILLDLKTTGDWNEALKHVPRRKIADIDLNENRSRFSIQRPNRIRVETLFSDEGEDFPKRSSNKNYSQNSVFNLETWGSKKKQDL